MRACFDDFYAPSVFTSSSSELWAPSLCLYDGLIGEGVVPPSRIYTLRQSGTNGGGEGAEENESCSGHGRNRRKAWHHSNRLGKNSFTIDGRSQTPYCVPSIYSTLDTFYYCLLLQQVFFSHNPAVGSCGHRNQSPIC